MLIRVLRDALITLRAAGWQALALGLLFVGSISIVLPQPSVLLFVGMTAQNLVTFALVRHLAAHRGLRAKGDAPPPLTRRRAPIAWRQPGPVNDEDRSAWRALGNAAHLGRSAMRFALVQLAVALGVLFLIVAVGGEGVLPFHPTRGALVRLLVGVVPVAALMSAFIALVPQRLAIEGDHRVTLAVLESIRIARSSYGTVFALSLIEPLAILAEVASGDSHMSRIAGLVVAPLLQLVIVAALNEVYAAAPVVASREPGSSRR